MEPTDLPLASPSQEQWAREIFPVAVSPEVYAARESHRWMCFSFDNYRYNDPALSLWIQKLGDILFERNGAPSVEALRARHLSPDEIAVIEAEIKAQCDGEF